MNLKLIYSTKSALVASWGQREGGTAEWGNKGSEQTFSGDGYVLYFDIKRVSKFVRFHTANMCR